MPIQRASLVLPSDRLEDWPSDLRGDAAAELLCAWTALWHPAIVQAIGGLPGWHSAIDPPDPTSLENELLVIPPYCRERLPADWCERLKAASPHIPPAVLSRPRRQETVREILAAASLSDSSVSPEIAADFFALGYAQLQVELLTRAMRYTSVLDADMFRKVVVDAARAAVSGDDPAAREQLVAAFDLLTDARNHFYAVDFYIVDVTLLAATTLGKSLREKLHSRTPTNLLATGALLKQLAATEPATLSRVREAIQEKTACVLNGPMQGPALANRSPEGMLAELIRRREEHVRLLGAAPSLYGQFGAILSPLLPEMLSGLGHEGALLASFDSSRGDRPHQPKSRWGKRGGPEIEILAAIPLDVAEPNTWLNLGERIGDTLSRDHVATILLAGWPGRASEYYDDLQRIATFGPVLGKFVTLDDYFRVTADAEDWTSFCPPLYPNQTLPEHEPNPISARVTAYRHDVAQTFESLVAGLMSVLGTVNICESTTQTNRSIVLNPWSFASPRFIDLDPLQSSAVPTKQQSSQFIADIPAGGFATLEESVDRSTTPLVVGRKLRNEFLEVVISETTGGIQSLRTHRDRSTRASQRLVMQDRRLPDMPGDTAGGTDLSPGAQMVAEQLEVTRSDSIVGEITARGRLIDYESRLLASFVQTTRIVRGLPLAIIDVRVEPEFKPEGNLWTSYFASRLAWRDDAVDVRCGVDWTSRPTTRRRIETPEWIEMADALGNVVCFACGLPFHRLAGPTWLDSILFADGESQTRYQFAIGLNCRYPTQTALTLLTAGTATPNELPGPAPNRGWLLHASAKNVMLTHVKLLPSSSGICVRLLETEGRDARLTISACRPLKSARRTDFLGQPTDPLPVVNGSVELEIGAHRWIQIQAEW